MDRQVVLPASEGLACLSSELRFRVAQRAVHQGTRARSSQVRRFLVRDLNLNPPTCIGAIVKPVAQDIEATEA